MTHSNSPHVSLYLMMGGKCVIMIIMKQITRNGHGKIQNASDRVRAGWGQSDVKLYVRQPYNEPKKLLIVYVNPTLNFRLAKTLKNLDINSPVAAERKEVTKEVVETPSSLPNSLKR